MNILERHISNVCYANIKVIDIENNCQKKYGLKKLSK